jgi:DNA-binding MarR family transcriptional regulator
MMRKRHLFGLKKNCTLLKRLQLFFFENKFFYIVLHIISTLMIGTELNIATNTELKEKLLPGFVIENTAKQMKLSFSRLLLFHPEIDITVDQWIIIQLLQQHGQLSQQKLAEYAVKDAPTVTRILDILTEKAYIIRSADPADRRKFLILLTEKGMEVYTKVTPLVQQFRLESYKNISDFELKVVAGVMAKIKVNLQNQP